MRQDAATAQKVVSRARELLAGSKSRMQRETLKAIIGIFDAHANKLSTGEPRNDCSICVDPGDDQQQAHREP
jgi:hypothetical protein